MTKLAFAVAIGLSFILLDLVEFDANNPNDSGLLMLALLYGLFPVVFKGVAILVMRREKN